MTYREIVDLARLDERGEAVTRRERAAYEKDKEKKRHQGGSGVKSTTSGPLSNNNNSDTLSSSDGLQPVGGAPFMVDRTDRRDASIARGGVICVVSQATCPHSVSGARL